MYPKKKSNVPSSERREKDKLHRREQMKNLITTKFQAKYSLGTKNREERDRIITREVNSLIDSQICTEKNLVALDKKLAKLFESTKSHKSQRSKASRHSNASAAMSNKNSDISKRSAIIKAGADILSQQKDMNNSYHSKTGSVGLNGYSANLNRSLVAPKIPDEWDNLIINDVKKYEEEQRQTLDQKRKLKQQIMSDLNQQMKEKEAAKKKSKLDELDQEQKRQNVHNMAAKREKQRELLKKMKNDEERKIMETQIAELENVKKFEKYNEKEQAQAEKQRVLKDLEDEVQKEKLKRKEYQEICQKQYQENLELKEYMKKKEQEKRKEDMDKKQDMFGNMFEKKKHVSYEYAAMNQRKFDALSKILNQENERKNRVRNYTEFEDGTNQMDK